MTGTLLLASMEAWRVPLLKVKHPHVWRQPGGFQGL